MKVILRSTVDNLGRPGDVKDVKTGYARNYPAPAQARGDRHRSSLSIGRRARRSARLPVAADVKVAKGAVGEAHRRQPFLLGAGFRGGQAVRLRSARPIC